LGAQFALGPCDAPGCRRCEAASQPSLLALPQRSVTRARYRGAVITAGTPEFRRPPQTRLASWHATHATSSVLPPLPTNVHPSHARQKHAPHRLRSTKNRCAEQGHTLRATRRHPPALIVFPLKTLASRPPAPRNPNPAASRLKQRMLRRDSPFSSLVKWTIRIVKSDPPLRVTAIRRTLQAATSVHAPV
jgi:hypothetical protein